MAQVPYSTSSSQSSYAYEYQVPGYNQAMQYALNALKDIGPEQTFEDRFSVVGGTPTTFTDIPQGAYLGPDQLTQLANTFWSDAAARTANQQRNIRQGSTPGSWGTFGVTDQMAQAQRYNDALAASQETNLRGNIAPTINRQAAQAQTDVERWRSWDDIQRRLATISSLRDQWTRENILLIAIAQYGRPTPYGSSSSFSTSGTYESDPTGIGARADALFA